MIKVNFCGALTSSFPSLSLILGSTFCFASPAGIVYQAKRKWYWSRFKIPPTKTTKSQISFKKWRSAKRLLNHLLFADICMPRRVRGFTSKVSTRGSGSSSKYWRAGCNFVPRTFSFLSWEQGWTGGFIGAGYEFTFPTSRSLQDVWVSAPVGVQISHKMTQYQACKMTRGDGWNSGYGMAACTIWQSWDAEVWGGGTYPCPISGLVKLQFANSCSCPILDLPSDKPQFSKNDTLLYLYIKLWCL